MDNTTSVEVDADTLTDWVGDRLPGTGLIRPTRMGEETGTANALFLLERDGRRAEDPIEKWVLRRPPAQVSAPGASNIEREWRILTALEGSDVPHPEPLLHSTDAAVIGAPFLIMRVVDGFTPIGHLPAPYDKPENRHSLAMAMVDALVALGGLDWRAKGLEGLGKPEGFLARQVPRWLHQLDGYAQKRDLPKLDVVASWLESHTPKKGYDGLMHGDYSPFNVMASPSDPTRLAAVIDWDTGTVGDPLLDIGHLLARWAEPGEESVILDPLDILDREGLPTRAEMAARYAQGSGIDLGDLQYYEVLALFKLAIILEGQVSQAAGRGNPNVAALAGRVDRLLSFADKFARGERA